MSSRRRHGAALLSMTALLLTACGTQSADDPEPGAAPTTTEAPTTPEPTPAPASTSDPTPVPEETCEHVDTLLRETKEVHPDAEVLTTALDAATSTAPAELAGDVADLDGPVREFAATIEEDDRFLVPTPDLPVSEDLTAACEPAGLDLDDVPFAVATPDETCELVATAGYWQDPKGMDLEEIVTFYLDRAVAHAPAEMEEQVRVYHERMLPLWEDHDDESEEDVQIRIDLAKDCAEFGHFVTQPDGAGYEDIPEMQQSEELRRR